MRHAVSCCLLLLATAAATVAAGAPPVLYADLGTWRRPVTTQSPEAQRYFDQGLVLTFAFNHEEARDFFAAAAELDPTCAMAQWGIAYVLGPHINNPAMDEDASRDAFAAVTRAKELAAAAPVTPVERDLIDALALRYAWPAPEDRKPLDEAYAAAMREVRLTHPDDADVLAMAAEALMDLRPWDLWTPAGEMQPGTGEVIAILEDVLAKAPDHPGANHFLIHTMEASPQPERAAVAADRLRDLVPDAGHLVHMPAHIDIRTGRYAAAVTANQRAIATDKRLLERGGGRGFFTLYRAHNYHFLAYAAMFEGRREVAMEAAREMVQNLPLETVRAFPDFLDAFVQVPIHVMVRFGLWQEILQEPEPPADLQLSVAYWRYGRTMALSALGRVAEAEAEFAAFQAAAAAVPESRQVGNNDAATVLAVGLPLAEGELEYRRGNHERAFALLREAAVRDDELRYDEPWGWMQPVRHALGALLLEQGQLEEAEAVYRADLVRHPGNGWALLGLEECLRRGERLAEAAAAEKAFRAAFARADIAAKASCYCRTGS